MNVLSLFDGMSCGQIALNQAGIKYKNYFASEIDKHAIKVCLSNYPKTIQIGNVTQIDCNKLPKIDLLIGDSPCQSFSFAGKRNGMITKDEIEIVTLNQYLKLKNEDYQFEGQSYLFWEYIRILKETKPKYFLLENVKMIEKWEKIINKTLGVKPILINSSLVSAQNRERLYWTNIGLKKTGLFHYLFTIIEQPKNKNIFIKDILENNVNEKYFLKNDNFNFKKIKEKHPFAPRIPNTNQKSNCLTIGGKGNKDLVIIHNSMLRNSKTGKGGTGLLSRYDNKSYCLDTKQSNIIEYLQNNKNDIIRRLTPIECERLQTVPDNYTKEVSDTQRYKMLGNGWTIEVIKHIFSYLK